MKKKKLLVVQVAGLGFDFLTAHQDPTCEDLQFHPMETIFPALTCPVQASFRTGLTPAEHGIVANGLWDADFAKVRFWEQAASLVHGKRIWEDWQQTGGTSAMLFWQQSLGENVNMVLSPAPIHLHHGGLVQDCYCQPTDLYQSLCRDVGKSFQLGRYWGPLASTASSQWIADAVASILSQTNTAPDFCMTYLPGLDYDLQRYGPNDARCQKALVEVMQQLALLRKTARSQNYEMVVFGDYAIGSAQAGAVLPNLILRDAGFFHARSVRKYTYPDFYTSKAFANVDHEIAHIHIQDARHIGKVKEIFQNHPGIETILEGDTLAQYGMAHKRAGELILIASDGYWFAYPWWEDQREAPDFARHIDIHNKPGYDPCELFWGWPPGSVSRDTSKIRGSHGRLGDDRKTAWASTCLEQKPSSLIDVAKDVKVWLELK
jgi:predicted AlkP superfamily pyrophosphatase or phosphodiesterase